MNEPGLFDPPKRESVPLNSTVTPQDQPRLSRQAQEVLDLFLVGKTVTTSQLMHIGAQYNARLYEVRRYLIPRGWCIDLVGRDGGQNTYRMVRKDESAFYQQNKHKFL